jgi:hypothetical protein
LQPTDPSTTLGHLQLIPKIVDANFYAKSKEKAHLSMWRNLFSCEFPSKGIAYCRRKLFSCKNAKPVSPTGSFLAEHSHLTDATTTLAQVKFLSPLCILTAS